VRIIGLASGAQKWNMHALRKLSNSTFFERLALIITVITLNNVFN